MKLLYITNGVLGSGGLERVLSIKATYLADKLGYEIYILGIKGSNKKSFYLFSPNIKFVDILYDGNFIKYVKNIRREVTIINPDIISVCDDGLKGFFIPRILRNKIPIIYERHASIKLNAGQGVKGKMMEFLMKSQIKKFDKFVVLSQGNIAEWNQKNVVAIPNPLSFYPEEYSSLLNKEVIVVGSHTYNKGYDLLLATWKNLELKFPDWKLKIYGKIDSSETFVKLAMELGLKNVFFYQPVKDIQPIMLKSSLLVLSSRSEGFGMVLIEAMACGLPCVSFNCPSGPADIIQQGEDGFLVEKENTEELANKIIKLMENEDLRKSMGAKAKKNVQRYQADQIVMQWDRLFKELKR